MKKETKFQNELCAEIESRLPGAIVLQNDPKKIQGIPDLTVLYGQSWATLECKESEKAHRQPNQKHYVDKMDAMSFSAFIYPENKEDVLNDMEKAFGVKR